MTKSEDTADQIEVRLFETGPTLLVKADSASSLFEAFQLGEEMLEGARNCRLRFSVDGHEFEAIDMVCITRRCGRGLDAEAGWTITADGDVPAILCPTCSAAAERKAVA